MLTIQGDAHRRPFTWDDVVRRYGAILPAYPAGSVVRVATVPNPPKLPRDSKGAAALMLVDEYRNAVKRAHDRCPLPQLTTVDAVRQHPSAKAVFAAVDVLRDRDVSPMAWCEFSIRAWTMFRSGKGRVQAGRLCAFPSLAWTYSAKRLAERDEWFAWEEGRFTGTRYVTTPAHRELLSRWSSVVQMILRLPAMPSEAEVQRIVANRLPASTYSRLLEEAVDQAEAMEAKWRRRMRRGESIW